MKPHIPTLVATAMLVAALAAPAPGQVAFDDIPWTQGPATGDLGAEAQVQVPAGCLFTGQAGTKMFMDLTQNPVSGNERGVTVCNMAEGQEPWFAVFTFDPSGYVRDDERDQLDAGALLENIQRGTEASNRVRKDRGWETITVEGWVREPFYDTGTNNLTWSLTVASAGGRSVNHSVRVLGREGVMHVDLVADQAQLQTALPLFARLVSGFSYKGGHRYAEWRQGDKVAEYGLTALVAGGAGVALAKSGLLGKLWKLIAAGVAAALAGLKRLFGRKESPARAKA